MIRRRIFGCYEGSNPSHVAHISVAQWNRAQRYERWIVAGSSPVRDIFYMKEGYI